MITLAEIAEKSGFSVPVVSRALSLNPTPSAPKVAEETRRKIRAVAKELGYAPNRTAEFLKKGKNPLIGFFHQLRSDALLAELLRGISHEASEKEFPLAVISDSDVSGYIGFLDKARLRNYCGIITYPLEYFAKSDSGDDLRLRDAVCRYQDKGGKVIVLEGRNLRMELTGDMLSVDVDHGAGGRFAAEYLLSRRPAKFFTFDYPYIPARYEYFLHTLHETGQDAEIFSAGEIEQLAERLCRYRTENPGHKVGIFATTDKQAVPLFCRLLGQGFQPGKDFFLVGYDNQYATMLTEPAITTIAQPMQEVGSAAVKLLINAIYDLPASSQSIMPYLVRRDT